MASPRRRRSTAEGSPRRPTPDEASAVDAVAKESKTGRELARLRAAVAELTEAVNELVRRQHGKAAG